jgi:glycosyltransferase involved in cell wall biosynthesis
MKRYTHYQQIHSDAVITFIIPTINRATLHFTLASLQAQTVDKWKAIILFDGCMPSNDLKRVIDANDRFLSVSIQKTGSTVNGINHHGSAGRVRNIGMTLVTTPWIGFVDDDDMLMPNYVQSLEEELTITPSCEFIIFRMVSQGVILPPIHCPSIGPGAVGISFCMKRSLFENDSIQFQQSGVEDYQLIQKVYDTKHKIVLSPHICYLVRKSQYIHEQALSRFIIH